MTSEIAQVKEKNERSLPENLDVNQRLQERTLSEIRYTQRELDQARRDQSFAGGPALYQGRCARGRTFGRPVAPAHGPG